MQALLTETLDLPVGEHVFTGDVPDGLTTIGFYVLDVPSLAPLRFGEADIWFPDGRLVGRTDLNSGGRRGLFTGGSWSYGEGGADGEHAPHMLPVGQYMLKVRIEQPVQCRVTIEAS